MQYDIEKVDPRGRTPLHLSISLGRTKCVKLLLDHGADVMATNRHQWSSKRRIYYIVQWCGLVGHRSGALTECYFLCECGGGGGGGSCLQIRTVSLSVKEPPLYRTLI